jgi:hypothetical protein
LQERYRMLNNWLATLECDSNVETRNEEVLRIAARIADINQNLCVSTRAKVHL